MERYGRIVLIFLYFLNIIFVMMGYIGISKIERCEYPPFNKSLMTVVNAAKYVPNYVISFWHSTPGSLLIWLGCLLLPIAAAYVLLYKQKIIDGILLLLLSIIPFGVVGFFIWLHAVIDIPHE